MKKIIITKSNTLKDSLYKLNSTGEKCLIVVDSKNRLIGTLSDGDLRKNLLLGINLNEKISNIFNKKPTFVIKDKYDLEEIKKIFLKQKYDLLPIVDKNKKVIDYLTWSKVLSKNNKKKYIKNNTSVVIMAGGKGSRLEPFTNILPKPLIPINNKTLIENIIEKFEQQNFNNFSIIANYKSNILKAYFKEIRKNNIKFQFEKKALGTASSINLLKKEVSDTFILTNCDIITNIEYRDILDFHNKNKYDLTLLASSMNYQVPYGVLELDKIGNLKKIDEKPNTDFFINVGLYIFEKKIIKLIPKNKFFNMDDLIKMLINKKKKIGVFPIHNESWEDYGQWNLINKNIANK